MTNNEISYKTAYLALGTTTSPQTITTDSPSFTITLAEGEGDIPTFYVGNNKILGYITYLDIYDRFEISNIYVLREFRGNGIASKMLQFVIDEGLNKKINNITLEVNSKNTSAIALYHKYGFKEVAIRSGYYSGTDGILMEKEMI